MKAITKSSIIFLILCVSSVHLLSNESSKPCRLRSEVNNVSPPTPAERVTPSTPVVTPLPSSRVWGVNSHDDIFTRVGADALWQHIAGKLKNISVGPDGRVWGVNSHDEIFTRLGVNGNWHLNAGRLKWVAAQ